MLSFLLRSRSFLLATAGLATIVVAAAAGDFNNKSIKGKFSFHLSATSPAGVSGATDPQTINRVGVMDFDGKDGNVTGRTVSVLDDGSETVVVDYNWFGTYSIAEDGLGTLIIAGPAGTNINSCVDGDGAPLADCEQAIGTETYRFVIVVGKKEASLSIIQTDGPNSDRRAFLRGVATSQEFKKGGSGGGFSLF